MMRRIPGTHARTRAKVCNFCVEKVAPLLSGEMTVSRFHFFFYDFQPGEDPLFRAVQPCRLVQ